MRRYKVFIKEIIGLWQGDPSVLNIGLRNIETYSERDLIHTFRLTTKGEIFCGKLEFHNTSGKNVTGWMIDRFGKSIVVGEHVFDRQNGIVTEMEFFKEYSLVAKSCGAAELPIRYEMRNLGYGFIGRFYFDERNCDLNPEKKKKIRNMSVEELIETREKEREREGGIAICILLGTSNL